MSEGGVTAAETRGPISPALAEQVSIILPFRAGDAWRDEVWAWLEEAWRRLLPGAEVIAADGGGHPFSRSASVNAAAARATRPVLAITDGDTWIEPDSLLEAAARVLDGEAWIPKAWKHFIDEDATRDMVTRPFVSPERHILQRCPKDAFTIPAPTILSRESFDAVNGFDERFRGWGCEDNAFILALQTLVAPKPRRAGGIAYHFWHPNKMIGGQQAWDGQEVAVPGYQHLKLYHRAHRRSYSDSGAEMRDLVAGNGTELPNPRVERLRTIWKRNSWRGRGTKSGPGSELVSTVGTAAALQRLCAGAARVLDVGCGECLWQPELPGYVGVDAVPEAIRVARKRHPGWDLRALDAVDAKLPAADVAIARDVFVHLSLDDGRHLLERIRATGARTLIATTFTDGQNAGPGEAGWYRVDMTAAPFDLGPPLELVDDGQHPGYNVEEKKLGVWSLA